MSSPAGTPTPKQVRQSYRPHGFDESASLKRARAPFVTRNILTGCAIVAFVLSVYGYSISAVKQDDFSDVVDLLPPEAERKILRTIEDELRDKELAAALDAGSPQNALPSIPTPSPTTSTPPPSAVLSRLSPRLSQIEWVKARVAEPHPDRDNVLVWGAPSVDKLGRMRDSAQAGGKRLV